MKRLLGALSVWPAELGSEYNRGCCPGWNVLTQMIGRRMTSRGTERRISPENDEQ